MCSNLPFPVAHCPRFSPSFRLIYFCQVTEGRRFFRSPLLSAELLPPPAPQSAPVLFLAEGFCTRTTIGVKVRERTRSTRGSLYTSTTHLPSSKQTRRPLVPARRDLINGKRRGASTESSLSRSSRDWVNKDARPLIAPPVPISRLDPGRSRMIDAADLAANSFRFAPRSTRVS